MNMNYTEFKIPKRKGGYRTILAPNPELKQKQEEILMKLYDQVKVSPFAHGGVPFKSIVTNAFSHVKQEVVGSIDIKDFFPSTTVEMFLKSVARSDIPSDLINEVVDYCFKDGVLPQGAPTSPFITNIILRKFDWSVAKREAKIGIQYTRYFDDITLSSTRENRTRIYKELTTVVPYLLEQFGYTINEKKTKIISKGRKTVCGVVVNEKLNVNRRYRKNLRAAFHQGNINLTTIGKKAFVDMVREADTSKLKTTIDYLIEFYDKQIQLAIMLDDKYTKKRYQKEKEMIVKKREQLEDKRRKRLKEKKRSKEE